MDAKLSAIKARILALVEIRRRAGVSAYHLAQLGGDLGEDDRAIIESATGKKLVDFLRDEFEFKLAKRGTAYFIHFEEAVPQVRKRPRYRREVWDAFVSPLAHGLKRVIEPTTLVFVDVPIEEKVGKGLIIPMAAIVLEGEEIVADVVSSRISQWISETAQDAQAFVAFPDTSKPFELDRRVRSLNGARKQNLWDRLVFELSADELKRINVPADVVQKLRAVLL